MRENLVINADGGFHMTCEAKSNLRYRVRTTTATIALVAGGYLAMTGALIEPAAAQSSNDTNKGGMLNGAPASSNATGKGGMLMQGAVTAPANDAQPQYQDKYREQKTSSNGQGNDEDDEETNKARKGGQLAPQTETSNKAGKDGALLHNAFLPGPQYEKPYDAKGQVDIYGAKSAVEPPRPPIEIGRQQYTSGGYEESNTLLGELNPLLPGLAVYGDWRTAVAFNQNNGNDVAQIATRLNIDVDFKITGTERIHAFFTPLQDNNRFTRFEFGGGGIDEEKFTAEFDPNPQTLFLEGDVGSLWSGFSGNESSFDLPFTVGLFPLFLQNGIWANDAILGGAVSLTAKNSAALGLANFDVTFFTAFDNVDNQSTISDVSANRNNNIANLYGVTAFIDAFDGYIETGYGLVQGFDEQDGLLTHFLTAAYTRRYYNTLSNSTRVFGNFGDGENNDGLAIISENSLISGLPSTLLPYANFFVGFGAPQPLVDGNGAGILKNVGINFETDALTGFPKLNDTGSNAYGGAIGLQYLFNLDQQLVFEVASVQPFGDTIAGIGTADAQYGFGVRYQIPLDKAWLFRADATYHIIDNPDIEDNFGVRAEVRRKF
jgi:hypothetical protein